MVKKKATSLWFRHQVYSLVTRGQWFLTSSKNAGNDLALPRKQDAAQ